METLATATVPTAFVPVVQQRLSDLSARLTKRGIPAPALTFGEKSMRTVCEVIHVHRPACPVDEWVAVSLVGEAPRYKGWSLLAAIDNMSGVPVLRTVPGATLDVDFRTIDPGNCDHCGIDRRRNTSYMLAHEDGRKMQAGSTCIRDFLGWDVSAVVSMWSGIEDLLSGEGNDDFGGYGGYVKPRLNFTDIIRFAANVASVDGRYVKSSDEDEATAEKVREFAFPPRTVTRAHEKFVAHYTSQPDRAATLYSLTMQGLDEMAQRDNNGEWAWNVLALRNAGLVDAKHLNIAVSAIVIGLRASDQRVEKRAHSSEASQHIGDVGKRVSVNVNILDVRFIDSQWGGSYLVTMREVGSANMLKWFASDISADVLDRVNKDEDAVFGVTGMVKKHDEYKGVAQTMLTRCKVTCA